MTRIYQLDTINQEDIDSSHVFPAEDSAGVETVQITLSQLTQYLFHDASVLSEGSPFENFNVIVGRESNAVGEDCSAVGALNDASDEGDPVHRASAFGYDNSASGYWSSSAFGYRNVATDSRTTSFGHKNHASDAGASAMGNGNIASGYGSTAAGYYNVAAGSYSAAVGTWNMATGNWGASAIGYKCHATYSQSSAIGHKNIASGRQSTAVGSDNKTFTNRSTAVGYNNIASDIIWTDTYNINSVDTGSDYFIISGTPADLIQYFDSYILLEQSSNNNGFYTIDSIVEIEGGISIYVDENIPDNNNDGYIRGDVSFRQDEFHGIFGVDQEAQTFVINGFNGNDFQNNFEVQYVQVQSSTGNNGRYTVDYISTGGEFTYIHVVESIPNATVDGNIRPQAQADGSGWGATAIGYKNQASDSQTTAVGRYNRVNSRESSAFGAENYVSTPRSTACGYENTCSNYYSDGGSGWGSSALGYRNSTYGSQASALGHRNVASGRHSTSVGSENTASGVRATAVGYANSSSGYGNTAVGYNNNSNADYSTAVGYNNNSGGNCSLSIGYNNNANDDESIAVGYNNNVNGNYSSAFGSNCYTNAAYSTAIGYSATTRSAYTTNIAGGIVVRRDSGESGDPVIILNNFSGVQNVVFTKVVDFTATTTQIILIPDGCAFVVDEVGILLQAQTNQSVAATVSFGWDGTNAGLLAATLTTPSNAGGRQKFTDLLQYGCTSSLTATVTVGATADLSSGRFYFKGILIENAAP